jgi:argininosuccinate lyase
MQAVEARISQDIFDVLGIENSVLSRTSFGGTAPARVREAVAALRSRLT